MIPELTCSIDLAKRLKELGVKQESLFYRFQGEGHQYIYCKYYEQYSPHVDLDINDGYSAFTGEEIARLLPLHIIKKNQISIDGVEYLIDYNYHFKISPFVQGYWHCVCIGYPVLEGFTLSSLGSHCFSENDKKMSNAIAKMVIHLLENKLMELPNE